MAEQTIDKLIIDISVSGNASSEIGKINTSLKDMGTEGKKSVEKNSLFSSLSLFTSKLIVMGYALKKVVNMFSGFVTESTQYTENLNLFRVTFGELADEAENFANSFANALGLDVSQVMRNMGFFNQISTGFGLASDEAYKMSETLTQISYDISSFFNLPIDDAISKVQSGLAGELEPLRRIGYALDQATLQQLAYNLGIEKSVRNMTQAEKAQLRTIAIYEQSKNVMGDLAETIESPANQLRILQQQFVLLSRSIGNIIVPILNKVIPYINGFVQGLTSVFNQVALIFGFELGQGARDSANSISEVSGAIEETENALKKTLLPFDKFLSLAQTETEDTSSSFTLEIPTYDALAGLEIISSKIEEISTAIKKIFLNFDDDGNIIGLKDEFIDLFEILKNVGIIIYEIGKELLPVIGDYAKTINAVLAPVFKFIADNIEWISKLIKISVQIMLVMFNLPYYIIKNFEVIKDFLYGIWKDFANGIAGIISIVANGILSIANIVVNAINLMLKPLDYLLSIFGISFQIPEFPTNINWQPYAYETGGFTPEITGSLFMAGENGRPELMGNVGGKNAVANVGSIESAMENASYRGMVKAISTASYSQSSQKDIVLNIDGKELTRATIKDMAGLLNKNYRMQVLPR